MSWISALSSWQWLILLAVPPLVVMLYFLKLRRQPLEVPSTFLWQKAIEDMQVNSLWQRLRRNLLLLFQLLFLIALIGACLRPGTHGNQATGRRWILLLDNSASMQATDVKPSRLEIAKAKMREKIGSMNRGDVGMLIAFSDRADIQQGFTGDKHRLLAAVEAVTSTNRTTDITEALRAASGLANPGRASFDETNDSQVIEAVPATVFIYSDGSFPALTDFEPTNLALEFIPIGSSSVENVSIEAFAVSRNEERPEELEAYGRVMNSGARKVELTASLYRENSLIDAASVNIEPEKDTGIRFLLDGPSITSGAFRLELDHADHLSIDNQAYAALHPKHAMNIVIVSPGNSALEKALSTKAIASLANVQFEDPSIIEMSASGKAAFSFEVYDLVIFDQCSPSSMPSTNTLFIGSSPPSKDWKFSEPSGPIQLLDVDRTHPMTMFQELGNIRIVEGRSITIPQAGQTLMQSNIGPIFGLASRGPYQDAVLGFDIVRVVADGVAMNTDWIIRPSFPVFIFGCVEYLSGSSTQSAASSTLPGQPVTFHLSSRYDHYRFVDPSGRAQRIDRNENGQTIWTETETTGVYQVSAEGEKRTLENFVVNLFSPSESNLMVKSDLNVGTEIIQATATQTHGRREYWRWILLLGLGVLLVEWLIYNRRVLV